MLEVKESTISIIGVDPGTQYTGICYSIMDINTLDISIKETILIELNHYQTSTIEEMGYPNPFPKLVFLKQRLENIFLSYSPSILTYETPFFYRFAPKTYGYLTSLTTVLLEVFYKTCFGEVYPFTPRHIKKTLHVDNVHKKESMRKSINKVLNKDNLGSIDLKSISEHEIDAIACILTLQHHLKNEEVK